MTQEITPVITDELSRKILYFVSHRKLKCPENGPIKKLEKKYGENTSCIFFNQWIYFSKQFCQIFFLSFPPFSQNFSLFRIEEKSENYG